MRGTSWVGSPGEGAAGERGRPGLGPDMGAVARAAALRFPRARSCLGAGTEHHSNGNVLCRKSRPAAGEWERGPFGVCSLWLLNDLWAWGSRPHGAPLCPGSALRTWACVPGRGQGGGARGGEPAAVPPPAAVCAPAPAHIGLGKRVSQAVEERLGGGCGPREQFRSRNTLGRLSVRPLSLTMLAFLTPRHSQRRRGTRLGRSGEPGGAQPGLGSQAWWRLREGPRRPC